MILDKKKPQITYPCEWSYKVIGDDKAAITNAIEMIFKPETYALVESRKSSGGKYVSLNINIVVFSEEERTGYYQKLSQQKGVKLVL